MQCNGTLDATKIGKRLQLKRLANGLSLQTLSEMLLEQGIELGKAALSSYEVGRTSPNLDSLDAIAAALGTTRDFFFRPDSADLGIQFFKDLESLPSKVSRLAAYVQICLEVYMDVEVALGIHAQWQRPEPIKCLPGREREIDALAAGIRVAAGHGDSAISSVCGMLEDMGYVLIPCRFLAAEVGAFSGYETVHHTPFIVYSTHMPTDDLRLALVTALGYVYLSADQNAAQRELQARRFAYAFLLPPDQIRKELGENRTKVLTSELGLLKCKYGISRKCIAAWLQMLDGAPNQPTLTNETVPSGLSQILGAGQEVLFFYEAPLKLLMLIEQCRAKEIEVADYISFMKYAVEIRKGTSMN